MDPIKVFLLPQFLHEYFFPSFIKRNERSLFVGCSFGESRTLEVNQIHMNSFMSNWKNSNHSINKPKRENSNFFRNDFNRIWCSKKQIIVLFLFLKIVIQKPYDPVSFYVVPFGIWCDILSMIQFIIAKLNDWNCMLLFLIRRNDRDFIIFAF